MTAKKSRSGKRKRATASTDKTLALRTESLLAEAIRRGREVHEAAENSVASYGEWLFANVFQSDTKLVLDRESDAPVWVSLLGASGSTQLPLSKTTLSTTVRIAALDKRLADATWSALKFSVKVALLPLQSPRALRSAARHVLSSSMSVSAVKLYVDNTLYPDGKPVRLNATTARKSLSKLSTQFSRPAYVEKLETSINKLNKTQRVKAKEALATLVGQLQQLMKKISTEE
jgi:hypothetical protein